MSSSRNKRKRPEHDASTMASASRRRSRDSRASTADNSTAEISNPKNGAEGGSNNEKELQVGEPSTKVPPQQPQTSLTNSKSKLDKPGGAINTKTTTTTSGSKFAGKNATNNNSATKAPSAASEENGSSQDASTIPRQPLHLSQDSKTKQQGGNDRGAKIQGLIRHRSILLHRIKLCRSAAERRLGEKDYAFVRTGIGSSSHDVSDDQELAAFRDLTWKSTQIAKKSKSGGGDGTSEKRSSLSLRRGSSVGKRMNAALHSLAPHHHSSTTADGAPVPAPIKPVSSTTPGKVAIKAPPQSNMQKTSSKSAFQAIPVDNKKLASAAISGRPLPSQVPLSKKATSSSSSILPNTSKQQYLNDAGTTTTKGRPPSSKGLKSSGRQSSVSALPLHTGAGGAQLPRNRLAMQQQQQKVHFPLAVGLRAKREMIQSKLNMLLDPRANSNDLQVAPPPRGKSSSKKKKNVIPPINPPVQLPPRRKTHWDSVLEEMRWMATDFIEERKWKTATARIIASSIPGPGVSIVSPRASRSRRLYGDGTAAGIDDIDVDKECKMDIAEESLGASGTKLPSNTTKKLFYPDGSQKAKSRVKQYIKPSSEDIKAAKKQGKIISAMVFELGEATSDCGSFKESDELSNKALDRFLDTRSNILHDRKTKADSSKKAGGTDNGGITLNGDSTGNNVDEKPTAEVESSGTSSSEEVEEVPFEKITEYFDRLAKGPGKTRGKVSVKEMANSMRAEKFQFGGEQKVALEFVDKLWANKPCFGAVLEGPPTSGKTISICTLLWKHRFKGPQLIVCSPASVLRWRYELGRFEDIRVLTVGLTGGICCPSTSEIIEPEEGDVLVCEYSTVDRALESIEEGNLLHSVVIDSRHPASFFATIGNSEEYDAQKEWYGRTELGTTSWWEKLSIFFNEYETRRLLVQYADKSRNSLVTSANPDREQLEILSLRFACMIGPKLFLSKTFPLQRRVMLWARQKGKKTIPEKTARVKRVLNDAIQPIVFRMTKSLASTSDIEWNLRLCSMPNTQRKAYDNCCSEVRGALAGNLQAYMEPDSSFRSFRPIVNALSRLRQQCFHSRGVDTISLEMIQNRLGDAHSRSHLPTSHEISCGKLDGVFWRKIKDSPAQPDVSLALDLMSNSAKLRELASILIFDCCLSSYVKDEVVSFLRDFKEESSDSDLAADGDPKKVAVLAVLPEIQMLISVFLNAAGIRHDLLHRLPTRQIDLEPGDGVPSLGQSDLGPDHWSSLAYSEKQHSLSNFSLDATEHSEFGCFTTTDVIVSSPEQVGSWMCGLSIESAEYIISVDEDWTCSGDFLLANILTRCLGRNTAKGDGPELIQLVCDDTVEKKIYAYRGVSEPTAKASYRLECQLDPTCFMRIPEDDNSAIGIYRDSKNFPLAKFTTIPGISLLHLRNSLLSDILVTSDEIAPRFLSGEKVCFLPEIRIESKDKLENGTNADAEKRSETAFLREFLRYERLASIRNPLFYQASDSSFHLPVTEGPGTEHPRNTGCPQSVVHFPSNLMTRQDLFSLSILFYFERQSLAFVWKPLAAGASSVSLAQLPCPDGTAEGSAAEGAIVNAATDLADMWAKSGLSRKPDDMATSLLFYGAQADNEAGAGIEINASPAEREAEKSRFNAYAKLYSTSWDGGLMRDGNQGTEALVFFPPLFPTTHACSRIMENRLRTILSSQHQLQQQQQHPNNSTDFLNHPDRDNLGEKKRKESASLPDDPYAPNPKRLRSDDPTPLPQPTDEIVPPPPAIDDDLLDNLEGILDDDDDVAPFAPIDPPLGALVPGSDPLMPDSVLNLESAEIGGFGAEIKQEPYKEEPMTAEGMELAIMGGDEDFGLLGAGALPTIDDPTSADVSDEPIRNGEVPDVISNPVPCDSEDVYGVQGEWVASTLNSVLLFVKRRPISMPIDTHRKGQPLGMPPPVGNWPGSHAFPYSMAIPGHDGTLNGHDTTKKRKKSASQTGLSALARPPPIDINPMHSMKARPSPNMMHFPPGKDSQQHRLHASYASRHYTTGLSMFESTAYQVAYMNVKNRLTSDLAMRQQKAGSKPGESDRARAAHEVDTANASFTGFVHPLKLNCRTGDAAKALASSQRSALRRSLVAPCRVDFGPFSGGYLALSSGMTGISPPRLRLGVSLPMGVKVSQIREQPQVTWSSADDKLLQDSATRFGMNWMVVARALTGLEFTGQTQRSSELGAEQSTPNRARSARQCRDRWQALARSRPSLANDIRKSERVLRENALNRPTLSPTTDETPLRAYAPIGQEVEFGKLGMLYSSSRTDNESEDHQKALTPCGPAPMEIDTTPQVSASDSSAPPTTTLGDGIKAAQEQTESTAHSTQQSSTAIPRRRSFAAFSAAKGKKQFIPLTVPGVSSGGQPNQPVASHASHMQSVEASIAAQWSSGRTEMWPLQILDCAEKYRATVPPARPTPSSGQQPQQQPRNKTGNSSSSSQAKSAGYSGSSTSSRRQTTSTSSQRSRSHQPTSSNQRGSAAFPAVPPNSSARATSSTSASGHRASSSSSQPRSSSTKASASKAATTKTTPNSYAAQKKSDEAKGKRKK